MGHDGEREKLTASARLENNDSKRRRWLELAAQYFDQACHPDFTGTITLELNSKNGYVGIPKHGKTAYG